MWEAIKFSGREWAVYDRQSRCYVLYGPKLRMQKRAAELNAGK